MLVNTIIDLSFENPPFVIPSRKLKRQSEKQHYTRPDSPSTMHASPPLKRYRDSCRKIDDDNNNPPPSRVALSSDDAEEDSVEAADGVIETEDFTDGQTEEENEVVKKTEKGNSDSNSTSGMTFHTCI